MDDVRKRMTVVERMREVKACEACQEWHYHAHGTSYVAASKNHEWAFQSGAALNCADYGCDVCAALVALALIPEEPTEGMVEAAHTEARLNPRESYRELFANALRAALAAWKKEIGG